MPNPLLDDKYDELLKQFEEKDDTAGRYANIPQWQQEDPAFMQAYYPEIYAQREAQRRKDKETTTFREDTANFLGNLAWGLGESAGMGAMSLFDIASKGELRESMNVDEWDEETWGGIAGRTIGEGIGFVGGLGVWGKLLGYAHKTAKLGRKTLQAGGGARIASQADDALRKMLKSQSDDTYREFSETLHHHGRKALKEGDKALAKAQTKKISLDDSFDLRSVVNKNFDELLDNTIKTSPLFGRSTRRMLLNSKNPATVELRKEIREASLLAARQYTPGNLSKHMQVLARNRNWNLTDKQIERVGHMGYEAILLGTHATLGTLTRDLTARVLHLPEYDQTYSNYIHDTLHGAVMGLGFGFLRYKPGGADVKVDPMKFFTGGEVLQSGMMFNMKQISQAMLGRWKTGAVKFVEKDGKSVVEGIYSPQQLQTMLRNVYLGSNKNMDLFKNSPGVTERLLFNKKLLDQPERLKNLVRGYNNLADNVRKELVPALGKEIGRDFLQSSPRMIMGSVWMNAEHWIRDKENMTPERIVHDFAVGAFYMKRGKKYESEKRVPFLGSLEANQLRGDEIAMYSRSLKMLGVDTGVLDYMGAAYIDNHVGNRWAQRQIKAGNERHPDLRAIDNAFSSDLVTKSDYNREKSRNPSRKDWREHATLEANKLLLQASKLKKQGKAKESEAAQERAVEIMQARDLTDIVLDGMVYGHLGKMIRPMTKKQAMEFLDKVGNIEIDKERLTIDNAERNLAEARIKATGADTSTLSNNMKEYLRANLDLFGIWNEAHEKNGIIEVHESALTKLAYGGTGSKEKIVSEYHNEFNNFYEVLDLASKTGLIKFTKRAIPWTGESKAQRLEATKLEEFRSIYKDHTENLHDILMDTQEGAWRELIPDKLDNDRYLDPNMLSQPGLWRNIEIHHEIIRNEVGKQLMTGKGLTEGSDLALLSDKIRNTIFNNKEGIYLEGSSEPGFNLGDKGELMNVLDNLNFAWKNSPGKKAKSYEMIDIKTLEGLHKDLITQVGDLFSNPERFKVFKNYLDKGFIEDMLGTDAIHGAKEVMASMLSGEHPFSVQDKYSDKITIANAQSIKDVIFGTEFGARLSTEQKSHVRKLIKIYRENIQNNFIGKGGRLEFGKLGIKETEGHSAETWYQTLVAMESRLDASKIMNLSRMTKLAHELYGHSVDLSKLPHLEKIVDIVEKRISIEQFKESLDNLGNSASRLVSSIVDAVAHQDAIFLNALVDQQFNLSLALQRSKQYTKAGKGSLEEVANVIELSIQKALAKRNEALGFEKEQDITDFYNEQDGFLSRKQSSRGPVSESATISEQQFINKYKIDKNSLDAVKGNILTELSRTDVGANILKKFIYNNPQLGEAKDLFFDAGTKLIENLERAKITPEAYINNLIRPWADAQWLATKNLSTKNTDRALSKEEFISDLHQVLISSWGQKKALYANWEDGSLRLSVKTVTDWNTGFLGIMDALNLNTQPNTIMLLGKTFVGGGRQRGWLNPTEIKAIKSGLMQGGGIKLIRKDLMSANERAELDNFLKDIDLVGKGENAKPQWALMQLDEKQAIVVSTSAYKDIANVWQNKNGPLYKKFAAAVGGEKNADIYLNDKLGLPEFKKNSLEKTPIQTETIEGLILTTRLLNDNSYFLDRLVSNEMPLKDLYGEMKRIKLANPRGGIVLGDKVVNISKAYVEAMWPDSPRYNNLKEGYAEQISRPQRQVTLYDEKDRSGIGEAYFSSDRDVRQNLARQLINEKGMDAERAAEKANQLADALGADAKSRVDGYTALSLPEMTALLITKGADPSWFIFNDANQVVGFNIIPKPLISQNKIDPKTGEISVAVGKTAYFFDPVLNEAMQNADGTYWTDSMSFKSAAKTVQYRGNKNAAWEERAISISRDAANTSAETSWKTTLRNDLLDQRNNNKPMKLMEIDRGSIMIKSLNGEHSGTISQAFGNMLTHEGNYALKNWLRTRSTINDLVQAFNDLYSNPFAYRHWAREASKFDFEQGDMLSSMTGIDLVLNEGGIPLYEHQRPQVERSVISNFLGGRNFVSGHTKNGSNSPMAPSDGLSHPIRENGVQSRFGGSGKSYYETDKSVRDLLTRGGLETISLIFRITSTQAESFNNQLAKKKVGSLFKAGDEIVVSSQGEVLSPHYAELRRMHSGPNYNREKLVNGDNIAIDILKESIQKHYTEIINDAAKDRFDNLSSTGPVHKVETLGELIRWIDGNPLSIEQLSRTNNGSDQVHLNDYFVTNGKNSKAQQYGYNAIRVTSLDLRNPKVGLNDIVISGIEKIIDRRKGPINEMNTTDVINPQDADHDIDKSSSFFAAPSKVVRDVYNSSGYRQASEEVLLRAARELKYEESGIRDWVDDIVDKELKVPAIIRQHSISSLFYQYFTSPDATSNRIKQSTIIRPGDPMFGKPIESGRFNENEKSSNEMLNNAEVGSFQSGSNTYKVVFRQGHEFINSVGHMKKMIKRLIDVYHKNLEQADGMNMQDHYWFADQVGMFKILRTKKDGSIDHAGEVSWRSSDSGIYPMQQKLRKHIITPFNDLFKLQTGSEKIKETGVTRNFGYYDYVKMFSDAKYKIWQVGTKKIGGKDNPNYDPGLENFAKTFLAYLGEGARNSETRSNHPLIDGLITIEKAHEARFPNRFSRVDDMANILSSSPFDPLPGSERIQNAITQYYNSEKSWAAFNGVRWELNQVENILHDLTLKRQNQTTVYKGYESKRKMLREMMNEIHVVANDNIVKRMKVAPYNGEKYADVDYAIYRRGKLDKKEVYRRGQYVKWNKGDVVVRNPRQYVFSDPISQKHRRSMFKAFGIQVEGVDKFAISNEYGYIKEHIRSFNEQIAKNYSEYSGELVKNSTYYKDLGSTNLETLKTFYLDAVSSRGEAYAKQFIYSLLTPKVSNSEISILNYDNKNGSFYKGFRFLNNKANEKLVVQFIKDAIDGNVNGFSIEHAKQFWKDMERQRNISYLLVHDQTLDMRAFNIGTLDRHTIKPNFEIIPKSRTRPGFLDVVSTNEAARSILQQYMTGTYFLSPAEVMRLTMDVERGVNENITWDSMGSRLRRLWSDTGEKAPLFTKPGTMGEAVYRMTRPAIDGRTKNHIDHIRTNSASDKIREDIICF